MTAAVLTQLQAGTSVSGGLTDVLDNARASYPNPARIFPRHGWFAGFVAVVFVLGAAVALVTVASVFARRRGASAERRKQLTPVAGVPLACVVAYAIVTELLVGVYVGLVLLATEVLTIKSPVAVAAATLAVAALFMPLRSRVQRMVDRRFDRTRYDADQTLTVFAARLKDAVDSDAVRADLLGVVQRSLEATHLGVWVRRHL
jgi:hypothetical protein